jgi:hypothetical protein
VETSGVGAVEVRQDVDISGVTGQFASQQWWAFGLLAAFVLVIFIGLHAIRLQTRRKSGDGSRAPGGWTQLGSIVGLDNRVSTSRTVALLWTVVVGYCLLAVVLIATTAPPSASPPAADSVPAGFFSPALAALAPTYLVLLGAPFVAAVAAKVVTTQGVASGSVQKTLSTKKATALDLVSDDDGNVDLIDLQYTLFNLIAITYVLTEFIQHPGQGLPALPAALVTLSGISAAGYTTKKIATTNPATITDVLPTTFYPGATVTIIGQNLLVSPNATDPASDLLKTRISLDRDPDPNAPIAAGEQRLAAAIVHPEGGATGDSLDFIAPQNLLPGTWRLRILTNAGSTATTSRRLTVL